MTRPTISLQATIGPGTAVTNPFIIGTSLIGGTDVITGNEIIGQGSWQEISDRAYTISTRRGRQRRLEQYRAGTLTAHLDNADGALDPAYTNGPYTNAGVTMLKPFAGVSLTATYAGITYPVYAGFADAWQPALSYPEGGSSNLTATDAFKIFTRINPAATSAVGAGELTGARIGRILDVAGWSVSLRDIETGLATHQATTLASTIAAQLRLAADSERGGLFIAGDGKVTFQDRLHRYTNSQSITPQWLIGDAVGLLQPVSFEPVNDDQIVYNDINVSRTGGTMVSRRDPAVAAAPYAWSTYTRTDLTLADDAQVGAYADEVLRVSMAQKYRVDSVTFEPDGYDDLWPFVLGAKFGDRCTVSLTNPRTGVVFTSDYFIEGIDHDIPGDGVGKWVTKVHLSDASPYPTHPFIIGTSLIGGTDVIV